MTAIASLDPEMKDFIAKLKAATPPEAVNWPLDKQRAEWNAFCLSFAAPVPAGITIEDHLTAEGVPLRLYRPPGQAPKPVLLYFHGGGWVYGGVPTHGDMVAELAARADVVAILVDYRLAPEHRHPAQNEDALSALNWVLNQGFDRHRIVAAGDSAGGQITAALSIHLRDTQGVKLAGQVLIYPVLGTDTDTPSYLRNREAPNLSRAEMEYYLEAFLGPRGDPNWHDPQAAPLLTEDLSHLPRAFISAAAHDPLHDDAMAYAERLSAAGVEVTLRREPALPHSYMRARHVSRLAAAGFDAIAEAIRHFAHDHN